MTVTTVYLLIIIFELGMVIGVLFTIAQIFRRKR